MPPEPTTAPPLCDFCHLPVPAARSATTGPAYCCYGCRLVADITRARGAAGAVNWMLTRLGIAIFCTMTVMMLSMYLYRLHGAGAAAAAGSAVGLSLADVIRYVCLLLAAPVALLLAPPILRSAIEQARAGVASTDALVVLGVAGAFVFSYVSTLRGRGETYYETGCAILVFLTLGRWLEANGKLRATQAIRSLAALLPERVEIRRNGVVARVAPADICPDDVLLVSAGDRIAADGVVLSGEAEIDEQLLTGESLPRARRAGDLVRAGTLAIDGALELRATTVGSSSTLGRMVALVEHARLRRTRHERLAERVARGFVPVTALLAVLAALLRHGGWDDAILAGLGAAADRLPCALGIATPMAVCVALGNAAARRAVPLGLRDRNPGPRPHPLLRQDRHRSPPAGRRLAALHVARDAPADALRRLGCRRQPPRPGGRDRRRAGRPRRRAGADRAARGRCPDAACRPTGPGSPSASAARRG
ncbi:MAG: HAD-IC family P-type ATPase [Phycisphaerae bacterium]